AWPASCRPSRGRTSTASPSWTTSMTWMTSSWNTSFADEIVRTACDRHPHDLLGGEPYARATTQRVGAGDAVLLLGLVGGGLDREAGVGEEAQVGRPVPGRPEQADAQQVPP